MKYAEVAVNSPSAGYNTFCYSFPPALALSPGQAVWVPFGSRVLQGIVMAITDSPSVETTREIIEVIDAYPLLSSAQIQLAFWISQYYLCPLFDAVSLMLAPGFERRLVTFYKLSPGVSLDEVSLNSEQREVIRFVERRVKVTLKELGRKLGKKRAELVTRQLCRRKLLIKFCELEKPKVRPKVVPYLKLEISQSDAEREAALLEKKTPRQASLLKFLIQRGCSAPLSEVKRCTGCSLAGIKSLIRRGLISIEEKEVRRDPLSHLDITPSPSLVLTQAQERVWQTIKASLCKLVKEGAPPVFLLHGVTGSGKTEIYLRTLSQVVAQGKRGICLVPEIALTPQTLERFVARFPGRVSVLHSSLSLGEQFDEWRRIKEGGCDVVVGTRSALFAPQPDLGLIILDEEHEWTYKQQDKSPRYHAREVAIKLAQLTGAVVILGSATPDVATFYRASKGEYQLLELKERVTPYGLSSLPQVEIVDLREELKAGNRSLLSRSLSKAITEVLTRREQAILFLNRRGGATLVQCRTCGFVLRCRSCSVSLTYHSFSKSLICHRCGGTIPLLQTCPQCFNPKLKFLGIGTQRVEEEIKVFFPQARLLRWDRDVTTTPRAHEKFLKSFRNQEADILIGTQMVAKGLDLPQVTLVGVINADIGLNLPDFRAGERTFQLLSQVAGRAGRGLRAGRVIIQTYCPDHYVLMAALKHDYQAFYEQEIYYRRQFCYPPFSRLICLTYSHTNALSCQKEAEKIARLLLTEIDRQVIPNLSLIGPFPAFPNRVRGRFRWQIVLSGSNSISFLTLLRLPREWSIDVDPVGLA